MNWKTLVAVYFCLPICLDAQTNTLRVAAGTSAGSFRANGTWIG